MNANRMRRVITLLALALLTTVETSFGFYNPSAGRWLNRDPLGERVGGNRYAFVNNNSYRSCDLLGLDSLEYASVGKTFIDGRLFGYTVERGFSGYQSTPSAWYWQSATELNCPGGLCNSGDSPESKDSSFVRAKVTLRSRCPRIIECTCSLSYSANTVIPKGLGQNAEPHAGLGGMTIGGHVLDTRFYRRGEVIDIGNAWMSAENGNETVTKRFVLAPNKSRQLYLGYTIVSVPVAWPGASFFEQMTADCSCSIIR